MQLRIHIIDHDYRRRMRIVHDFVTRRIHAEIYEDVAEFARRVPTDGCIFAVEDEHGSAAEVVRSLQACGAGLPVVIYSDQPTPEKIVRGMLSGAVDYLAWPFDPQVLETSLERLASTGPRYTQAEKLRLDARNAVDGLSPREREVLTLMCQGMSNKDMALSLALSPRTVELHRKNMMRRVGARSTSDAVRIAIYAGVDAETQGGEESSSNPAAH